VPGAGSLSCDMKTSMFSVSRQVHPWPASTMTPATQARLIEDLQPGARRSPHGGEQLEVDPASQLRWHHAISRHADTSATCQTRGQVCVEAGHDGLEGPSCKTGVFV
jgi:hypothetical protein